MNIPRTQKAWGLYITQGNAGVNLKPVMEQLETELSELQKVHKFLIADTCDTEERIKDLCEKHGIVRESTDDYHKSELDCVEELSEKMDAALAQVVQMREALEKLSKYDEESIWNDDRDDAANCMLDIAREALSSPAPAVVPLADALPLLELVNEMASWDHLSSDFEISCAKAYDNFLAKHPKP